MSASLFPKPIGRLAPSPTGAQHLGNARTFLIAWWIIRRSAGTLLLRIEDLESPRRKPWASQQLIEDLQWLGIDWDYGPQAGGFPTPLVQSDRLQRYEQVLEQLIDAGHLYPCTCTRRDVEQASDAPHESTPDGNVYPGNCRRRSIAEARQLMADGHPFAWRFRLSSRRDSFVDLFSGQHTADPANQLGDFPVARSPGPPAYQLAVVVDDHDAAVDLVVRGDDLLWSTFRQRAIYHALDWEPPAWWLHPPLVVGPDGRRLAKRHGDTRLATLRQAGVSPEQIIGWLAAASGWIDRYRPLAARELLEIDLLERTVRHPIIFPTAEPVPFFRQLADSRDAARQKVDRRE